jgi:hypothetical protein
LKRKHATICKKLFALFYFEKRQALRKRKKKERLPRTQAIKGMNPAFFQSPLASLTESLSAALPWFARRPNQEYLYEPPQVQQPPFGVEAEYRTQPARREPSFLRENSTTSENSLTYGEGDNEENEANNNNNNNTTPQRYFEQHTQHRLPCQFGYACLMSPETGESFQFEEEEDDENVDQVQDQQSQEEEEEVERLMRHRIPCLSRHGTEPCLRSPRDQQWYQYERVDQGPQGRVTLTPREQSLIAELYRRRSTAAHNNPDVREARLNALLQARQEQILHNPVPQREAQELYSLLGEAQSRNLDLSRLRTVYNLLGLVTQPELAYLTKPSHIAPLTGEDIRQILSEIDWFGRDRIQLLRNFIRELRGLLQQ